MDYYVLLSRSLTYAQRSVALLERGGISASLTRLPKQIASRGCGYGVKLASRNLTRALALLDREQLSPRALYGLRMDGSYEEYRR